MKNRERLWRVGTFCVLHLLVFLLHVPLLAAPIERDAAWDAAFFSTDGWAGGDAAYSVDLRDGRVLWLFADTWLGPVVQGRRGPGTRLVNNTLAVHPKSPPGQSPPPQSIRFHWGQPDADGHPTAWIAPDVQRIGPEGWYWLADGAVVRNAQKENRLVIFLWRMDRLNGRGGAFDFKSLGGAIAIVENPHDPVEQWRATQHPLPHDGVGTFWGNEVLPVAGQGAGEDLYVFGSRGGQLGSQLLLARVRDGQAERAEAWEFRTADGWSSDPTQAAPLATGLAAEFSISQVKIDTETRWVMVHHQPMLGRKIMVRFAHTVFGPWSEPQPIFTVAEVDDGKKFFTYAAKAHPELSAAGELLITYVVNAFGLGDVLNDASIYRPRFLRLDLRGLPPP